MSTKPVSSFKHDLCQYKILVSLVYPWLNVHSLAHKKEVRFRYWQNKGKPLSNSNLLQIIRRILDDNVDPTFRLNTDQSPGAPSLYVVVPDSYLALSEREREQAYHNAMYEVTMMNDEEKWNNRSNFF